MYLKSSNIYCQDAGVTWAVPRIRPTVPPKVCILLTLSITCYCGMDLNEWLELNSHVNSPFQRINLLCLKRNKKYLYIPSQLPQLQLYLSLVTPALFGSLHRYSDLVTMLPKGKIKYCIFDCCGSSSRWCLLVVNSHFSQEIRTWQNGWELNHSTSLLTLHPFLDQAGLLQEGGIMPEVSTLLNIQSLYMVHTLFPSWFTFACLMLGLLYCHALWVISHCGRLLSD